MSQNPLLEVELYTFASGGETFYLTPHEFDVQLDASLYRSQAIERNELTLGAEATKSALELKTSPQCDLVRHLLSASVSGDVTAVTLSTARRESSGDDVGGTVGSTYWWLAGTRWMGRVLGVEVADDSARILCESAQVSLKRIGLRRLYSRKCSHVLYSSACGATPISASSIVSSTEGRTVTLLGGIAPSVSGGLAGGWLQTPQGARHMIVSEWGDAVSGAVELLYPVAIESGTQVRLTVGCDHSTATCAARFNNLENYGGFPAIPSKNPFATGVF